MISPPSPSLHFSYCSQNCSKFFLAGQARQVYHFQDPETSANPFTSDKAEELIAIKLMAPHWCTQLCLRQLKNLVMNDNILGTKQQNKAKQNHHISSMFIWHDSFNSC